MIKNKILPISAVLLLPLTSLSLNTAFACDSCFIPHMGRSNDSLASSREARDGSLFVDFTFEQQLWKTTPFEDEHTDTEDSDHDHEIHTHHGDEAHTDEGHSHNKTQEEFYHITVGGQVTNTFSIIANLPYVVRSELRATGTESSDGVGDLSLLGRYRIYSEENNFFALAAGIKAPTGSTNEKDSEGIRFEPELQPGSGSWDYIVGGLYQISATNFLTIRGNAFHIFKTEGDQDFKYGDLTTASLFLDTDVPNDISPTLNIVAGLHTNLQYEAQPKEGGIQQQDSTGLTLLLGPALTIEFSKKVALTASVQFPVYQNTLGEHQPLEQVWSLGVRSGW